MIHTNISLKNYYYILENEARRLGYRVSYYASVNKACHHPNYVIFIKKPKDINNVFSYAHEIGHCIEFKKGDFDFNRYRSDTTYRQYKESAAWLLGYKVCLQLGIPVNGYWEHAYFCYKSYEDRLEDAGAIDLRDNHKIIDHGDGYATIEPIDKNKKFKKS